MRDEHDPSLAHRTCPIEYDSPAFATQGGGCDRNACSDGLWQGGTPEEYAVINEKLSKATGQAPPPACGVAARK